MNRIYLIIFSLLITLSFVIGKSSACPPSGRPRCNIYGPRWIIAGQVVEFTSSSYDPDGGPIEEYQWRLIWCDDCTIVSGQNTEEMSCKFDTGCTAYVKLRVRDNEDMWSSWDYHKVYVMKVSLSGGGYICLGDRVPISLSVEAHDPDDAWFELDDPSDDDKIEVWDGQTEVELPAGWSVSGVPDTLDVKGISTSSGLNDVQLELLYINTAPRNPTVIDSDTVEFTVVEVDEVTICKPTGTDWAALSWEQVLLEGEPLRIKANITPSIPAGADFSIDVAARTSYTNPTGISVTLDELADGGSVLRGASSTSSLTDSHGGGPEFTSADNASGSGSNFNDSDQFDSDMSSPSRKQRGKARNGGNESASPPEGGVSKTFMQAAGVEYIEVIYNESEPTEKKDKNQIENQADSLYFSGHGNHATGGVVLYPSGSFSPSDVLGGQWDHDLGTVFFAACAVLDVDDLNGNYDDDGDDEKEVGPASLVFPGEKWAEKGPNYFMGYNYISPLDHWHGDPQFTAKIIHKWKSDSEHTTFDAWGYANKYYAASLDDRPYNACAIDARWSTKTYYYWKATKSGGEIVDRDWESYDF